IITLFIKFPFTYYRPKAERLFYYDVIIVSPKETSMKLLFITLFICAASSYASAQDRSIKTKITEVKKRACTMVNGKEECTIKDVKVKACPVINGKEECSAQDVKAKLLEM